MSEADRHRVHLWTPWGRDRSGIANYCRHLAPALDRHMDVSLVHPGVPDPVIRTVTPAEARRPSLDGADLDLFHIGNNVEFHHWMLGPLYERRGVVVLHDWSLFDLMRPLTYRSFHLWMRELALNGESDPELSRRRQEPGFLMAHPLNRRVLEAADALVVHTEWLAEQARAVRPELDVRVIPHGGRLLPSSPVTDDSPILVLGGLGPHKRTDWALRAFAEVLGAHPNARLSIVGRLDERSEVRRLQELAGRLGVARRVSWTLDASREAYLAELARCRLVVTLRGETAGEMSGVLVEAWGAAKVAVTSDQPQFAGFDERYCRRVSLGDRGVGELAGVMAASYEDPGAVERDGRAAHDLVAGPYSFESVAERYAEVVAEHARPRTAARGVNVWGSWGSSSGLIEVANRITGALLDQGVELCAPRGFRLPDYDARREWPGLVGLARRAHYGINLITANVNELHDVPARAFSSSGAPTWDIGLWIYEFPELSEVLAARVGRVEEIWCGTSFAAGAFRPHFDGPIRIVPNVVVARPQHRPLEEVRRRHGLRPGAVVVLFTFDFSSGWARKNPLAVVAAFRGARAARPDVDAQLVIKTSRLAAPYDAVLARELESVGGVLIDEHLSDADLGDLFHAADVYCSLHRAEGFGLGMAEAMAIGKTVVATRYSGNLDFMDDSCALLVDASMTSLTREDCAANPGLERIVRVGSPWAEPDAAAAVEALATSFDPGVRDRLGPAARANVERVASPAAVGALAKGRLDELAGILEARVGDWPRIP